MTEPTRSHRAVTALAALVHEAQREAGMTAWGEAGIAAEARRHPGIPLFDLGITLLRAASIPSNETPACISQEDSSAWRDDHPYRCRKHPETRARRTNGECAACWTDRQVEELKAEELRAVTIQRMPQEARDQMLAAIDASLQQRRRERDEELAAARAELEATKPEAS